MCPDDVLKEKRAGPRPDLPNAQTRGFRDAPLPCLRHARGEVRCFGAQDSHDVRVNSLQPLAEASGPDRMERPSLWLGPFDTYQLRHRLMVVAPGNGTPSRHDFQLQNSTPCSCSGIPARKFVHAQHHIMGIDGLKRGQAQTASLPHAQTSRITVGPHPFPLERGW
jgi:hypothetical protein